MEIEKILKSVSDTALEISDEIPIKIGSFEKTKKELLEILEERIEYEDIFEQWFPHEKITPENLKKAPRRILKEFVLATVLDFAVELSESENRSVPGLKIFLRKLLLKFEIDSLELKTHLIETGLSSIFIESFIKWIYL